VICPKLLISRLTSYRFASLYKSSAVYSSFTVKACFIETSRPTMCCLTAVVCSLQAHLMQLMILLRMLKRFAQAPLFFLILATRKTAEGLPVSVRACGSKGAAGLAPCCGLHPKF